MGLHQSVCDKGPVKELGRVRVHAAVRVESKRDKAKAMLGIRFSPLEMYMEVSCRLRAALEVEAAQAQGIGSPMPRYGENREGREVVHDAPTTLVSEGADISAGETHRRKSIHLWPASIENRCT